MRAQGVFVLAALAACYAPPTGVSSCEIQCTETCPGDLTCVHGYCLGPDETCETRFEHVSAGNGYACALDTNHLRWCWGANTRHQIDATDTSYYNVATQIGTTRWDAISSGGGHTCALRNGELSCWGANDRGQISATVTGDLTDAMRIGPPDGMAAWSYVATGYNNTCAIADGALYCWGAGDTGQLGNGTTIDVGIPTRVMTTITDWVAVDLNTRWIGGDDDDDNPLPGTPYGHACAISDGSGLFCWGGNTFGELGDGTKTASLVPVPVALPSAPVSVAVQALSTCTTTITGQLYCWGYGANGELGDPQTATTLLLDASRCAVTPILASGLDGWSRVSAAERLACALRGDEVWCWGYSKGSGGLANGVWTTSGWARVASGATDLSVGWNANLDDLEFDNEDLDLGCLINDGKLACWGDNRYGQLAQGGSSMQPKPVEVVGNHTWDTIAAGGSHVCGIEAGNLLCWGSTVHGAANGVVSGTAGVPCGSAPGLLCDLPSPTTLAFAQTATKIGLGLTHSCALDGTTITCWGDDTYTQLGVPSVTGNQTVAGTWTGLFDVGTSGQCGVQGGETWCWGAVTGAPSITTHVADLDSMGTIGVSGRIGSGATFDTQRRSFGCILDNSQQLSCFGDNSRGAFGNGRQDCGTPPYGDGMCTTGETTANCPSDCPLGVVAMTCGNGVCDYGETYAPSFTRCTRDCTGVGILTTLPRRYTSITVSRPTVRYSSRRGYFYNATGFACGILPDQRIECWGRNERGPLGNDTSSHDWPQIVNGLAGCTLASAGDYHACALCGGDLYCWGDHRYGAVGAGPITKTAITTPRKVDVTLPDGDTWAQLVSGLSFSCARTTTGRAYCWGFSPHGALGSGGASANLPIPVLLAQDPIRQK